MSNLKTDNIESALTPLTQGRRLVITVGNSFRSDDGVGPFIADRLAAWEADRGSRGAEGETPPFDWIDAGQNPENIIDAAIEKKPDQLVVIDAADFGGRPGEARIIPEEHIPDSTLSTHMVPLNVITRIIADATGSETLFLGIQAVSFALGEGLSDPVRETAEQIVEQLTGGNTATCENLRENQR